MPDEKVRKKWWKSLLNWILTIILSFIMANLINTYLFRITAVSGTSMEPTFCKDDVVFLSRIPYIFEEPKHGDILVFDKDVVDFPKRHNFFTDMADSLKYNIISQKLFGIKGSNKYWIKRVIGVEGDIISVRDKKIYRNGELLEETYILNPDYEYDQGDFIYSVGEGYLFVMGDNRGDSVDSREIGLVPVNAVIGKVVLH